MSDTLVVNGTVAFSHLQEIDEYQGKPTNFNVTVTLDDASAKQLEDMGVKLREYEGSQQKKFTTTYKPQVLDMNNDFVNAELTRGSKVRVLAKLGNDNADYGVKAYLQKVRLVEMADNLDSVPDEF